MRWDSKPVKRIRRTFTYARPNRLNTFLCRDARGEEGASFCREPGARAHGGVPDPPVIAGRLTIWRLVWRGQSKRARALTHTSRRFAFFGYGMSEGIGLPMHQFPVAVLQPEDHHDAQRAANHAWRLGDIGLEPLEFEDV
jgi:hypothetical protein